MKPNRNTPAPMLPPVLGRHTRELNKTFHGVMKRPHPWANITKAAQAFLRAVRHRKELSRAAWDAVAVQAFRCRVFKRSVRRSHFPTEAAWQAALSKFSEVK